jgi:hypothetical protein
MKRSVRRIQCGRGRRPGQARHVFLRHPGTGKNITEVLVSAIDGHIVNVSRETAAKEAAEKKKEAQETKQSPKKTTRH